MTSLEIGSINNNIFNHQPIVNNIEVRSVNSSSPISTEISPSNVSNGTNQVMDEHGHENEHDDDDGIYDQDTNCIICFEKYNDNINQRYFLECSHSYCIDCVSKFNQNSIRVCPSCRHPINAEEAEEENTVGFANSRSQIGSSSRQQYISEDMYYRLQSPESNMTDDEPADMNNVNRQQTNITSRNRNNLQPHEDNYCQGCKYYCQECCCKRKSEKCCAIITIVGCLYLGFHLN